MNSSFFLCWLMCAALVCAASTLAQASLFPVSEDGKASCAIVSPRSPTDAEALAVKELTRYLKKITGARFSTEHEIQGKSIVLCAQGSIQLLSPQVVLPQLATDGYCIVERGENLFVVGADSRGVLYAAYDLLQRLGCRWLSPDLDFYKGANEVIPRQKTLSLTLQGEVIENPVFKYRKLYVEEGHSHNKKNLRQMVEWMPKRRFNTLVVPTDYGGAGRVKWDTWRKSLTPELQRRGICIEVGGHGYQNFLNPDMEKGQLFKKHPEWFGANEKGERLAAKNRVFCVANQDAFNYLVANVVAYLKKRPEIAIFDLWPPDGAQWCQCDACKILGEPTDRHALVVSRASEIIKKAIPDIKIECIAYSSYVDPPGKFSIDREVLIDFCPIAQCFEYQIYDPTSKKNAEYVSALKGWKEIFNGDISIYSYYRKYAWNSLPISIPHYMQNDLRFYRSLGVSGISSYAEPGDWATYELNHYVLGAIAWNPDVDVDREIDLFIHARFGDYYSLARQAYRRLEEHARHASSIPGTSLKSSEEYAEYALIFESIREQIETATTQTSDKRVSAALNRLDLNLRYLFRDIILRKLQADGAPEEQAKMLELLRKFIEEHSRDGILVADRINNMERLRKHYNVKEK